MLSTDRTEFQDHLGTLCAGFNVPMTELRNEAYWLGLRNMQLGQFVRVVEHALGEDGPERIPTATQCWLLWKKIRAQRPRAPLPPVSAELTHDALHCFGQRCLLRWLRENGPVSDDVLPRLVAEKNRLLEQFRIIADEEQLTAEDVRPAMLRGFGLVAQTA